MAEFRMMTWNVENLFLTGTGAGPQTQADFDAKLTALAGVIGAQRPDVLALQEVGQPDALALLQQALADPFPHQELSTHPDQRGIRVAVLSRHPLHDPVQLHAFPTGLSPVQVADPPNPTTPPATQAHMGRGALHVRVTASGHDLVVVIVHLKSKLLSFPGHRFTPKDEDERARFAAYALGLRAAEAVTVRTHMSGVLGGDGPSRGVVLAGDLNDGVDAATTQLLNGPPGSELGTAGFDRPDQGDAQRMWNLAPLIPEAQRFSRVFHGRRELIDHVLVSRFLVTKVAEVTTVAPGPLPSVTEHPAQHPGSDHAAVLATFNLP